MGLGVKLGEVVLKDGTTVHAGRALFRGTWNAALHDPLAASFDESQGQHCRMCYLIRIGTQARVKPWRIAQNISRREDSGLCYMVGWTLINVCCRPILNAQMKGFDAIMLNDGCATDSPEFTQAKLRMAVLSRPGPPCQVAKPWLGHLCLSIWLWWSYYQGCHNPKGCI